MRVDDQTLGNLKMAGCPQQMIQRLQESEDDQYQLMALLTYRKELLTALHEEQAKMDCLDYLIFSLRQRQGGK